MTHADNVAERAWVLIDARRYQDAIQVAYEGLHGDPTNARLLGLIATALLAERRAVAARTWAERALWSDPNAAWVHDLRAQAILAGAGKPTDAAAAARAAVQINPQREDFLFTYAHACIENRDWVGARWAVQAIRHTAPASELGPLAEALLELSRAGVYVQWRYLILPVILVAVVTRGFGLVLLAIWWLIRTLWRIPRLARVDALLHEALAKAPASGHVRTLAAEVLRLRFRFAKSVEYEVAAAAIDAGLVNADALARSISRRTTVVTAVGAVGWAIGVVLVDLLIGTAATVAAIGAGLAGAIVAMVTAVDRWQTRSLPPLLTRNVRGRWPLPVMAMAATGWVVLSGILYLDPVAPAPGYHLASLVTAPLVIAATAMLLVRRAVAVRPR